MSELRALRRERVFALMKDADLDALVLGRRDSVVYATGARSLWTAGTRPFGAACVLVAATDATHLLSTWDAGVPPEVPFEHLYGVTWNPATMAAALRAISGFADARRIGVDALSPGFQRAAGRLAPDAELVPVDDLLHAVRAVKLPAEVDLIQRATSIAREAVEVAAASGLPAALRLLGERGATVPSSPPVLRTVDGVTHVDIGVIVDGYEGGCGRSFPSSPDEVFGSLVAASVPGATAASVRAAAGEATGWLVRGIGLGFEPPVITPDLGADVVLQEGMTLSVETAASRDIVVLTPDGNRTL